MVMFIHNNRSFLQRNGMRFYLTNEKKYENIYSLWLEKLSKTKTIVFLFEIAPTNDSIEMQSPGFRESIKKYNLLLENAVNKINGPNIHLIKINSLICKQNNINNYIIEEDGHHITSKAHTLFFNSIKEVLDLEETI
jgi:lysophospholipase L1-like esterase